MSNINNICNYIIYRCNKNKFLIDSMKLNKLLYYVQGCALVLLDRQAFSDEIIAFPYGPVVKRIFEKYRSRGSLQLLINDEFDLKTFVDNNKELSEIIDLVCKYRGHHQSVDLAYITHGHDTWKKAINTSDKHISKKAIKKYFREEIVINS